MLRLAKPSFLSVMAVVMLVFACLAITDLAREMFSNLLITSAIAIIMGAICGLVLLKRVLKKV